MSPAGYILFFYNKLLITIVIHTTTIIMVGTTIKSIYHAIKHRK